MIELVRKADELPEEAASELSAGLGGMKKVVFEALEDEEGNREGEAGWRILVDGIEIVKETHDMDVSWIGFNALWEALGAEVTFDFD